MLHKVVMILYLFDLVSSDLNNDNRLDYNEYLNFLMLNGSNNGTYTIDDSSTESPSFFIPRRVSAVILVKEMDAA